jgi:RNA polymerase sigma-70 factor (ECF subfamily)
MQYDRGVRQKSPATHELDDASSVFASVRPRLFGIAYRMLGSASEAEDIVQDAWLKWQTYDRSTVREPAAFLATMTTRLSINAAQTARVRHETYIGPWLPEPVDTSHDPLLGAERSEALEIAVLMLLEKLTPTERAAYVLREAFDYPYSQIADVIDVSEESARQLVSRARKHVSADRHTPVDAAEQRRLLDAFLAAAQTGDLTALERLFAADVVSYSDGGGVRNVSRVPVVGRSIVAKFLGAFGSRFWPGVEIRHVEANGQHSAQLIRDGGTIAIVTVNASAQGINQLLWVMNPAKLGEFEATAT